MNGRVIALDRINGRKAAALVEDGVLADFLIDGDTPAPGTIYRAICDRPLKGTGGLFLRLPDGQAGFLRQGRGMHPGQVVRVQVAGYAERGKAVPVSANILFKSRYCIVTPDAPGRNISRSIRDENERARLQEIADSAVLPDGFGAIIRSRSRGADAHEIQDDLAAMRDVAEKYGTGPGDAPDLVLDGADAHARASIDWPQPDLLDERDGAFTRHGVHEMIAALRDPRIDLGAASAFIEPTRALVAVDVNTGCDASPAAGLKANIALASDLPRQLRCRGLGGQITLDLAPMAKKDRRGWEQVLARAFRADPIETALAGWTPLGHFELQRKRARAPVAELIRGS